MMRKTLFLISFIAIFFAACKQQPAPAEQPNPTAYFSEPHRPQFHFSPDSMWMNDPNGLVYYKGVYHLFFQHYPDSTVWGPMHWGHATSTDLVHWQHQLIALYPDSLGYIFSGSAVVDWGNTSGFGKDGQPPLVAIFTYHDPKGEKAGRVDYQTEGIAYSTDGGQAWTKYAGNPVLKNPGIQDFRDPKVMWHAASKKWIMTLAVHDHLAFYSSPDLKNWTHESDFGKDSGAHGGVWECPDLFPLQVEGTNTTKWVLMPSINPGGPNGGTATQYFIGNFDGKKFTDDNSPATTLWVDYGRDDYAGVTWSDIPKEDGRRIFLGWMSNWQYSQVVPTQRWRSAMTIPRTLTLRETPAGLRVFSTPVQELEKLREKNYSTSEKGLDDPIDLTQQLGFSPKMMEAILEFELPEGAQTDVGIELSNDKGGVYRAGYDAAKNQFYSDRTNAGVTTFSNLFADKITYAPRVLKGNTVKLHIYFDVASAEIFGDDGGSVMTDIFFPIEDFNHLKLYAQNGTATLKNARFYQLASIWN